MNLPSTIANPSLRKDVERSRVIRNSLMNIMNKHKQQFSIKTLDETPTESKGSIEINPIELHRLRNGSHLLTDNHNANLINNTTEKTTIIKNRNLNSKRLRQLLGDPLPLNNEEEEILQELNNEIESNNSTINTILNDTLHNNTTNNKFLYKDFERILKDDGVSTATSDIIKRNTHSSRSNDVNTLTNELKKRIVKQPIKLRRNPGLYNYEEEIRNSEYTMEDLSNASQATVEEEEEVGVESGQVEASNVGFFRGVGGVTDQVSVMIAVFVLILSVIFIWVSVLFSSASNSSSSSFSSSSRYSDFYFYY